MDGISCEDARYKMWVNIHSDSGYFCMEQDVSKRHQTSLEAHMNGLCTTALTLKTSCVQCPPFQAGTVHFDNVQAVTVWMSKSLQECWCFVISVGFSLRVEFKMSLTAH